ncbi:MAG: RNA polymerase sigma-54 factor, partial [Desulfobacterales bacterium]|nr:RNA polymerase sigma-54 factor [Desulfobacterales bacterium]
MALELRQQLKLTQQLIMTPQLQMAIKLLQLSRQELVDKIKQELEENPALEEVQETLAEEQAPDQKDKDKKDETSVKEVAIEEKINDDIDWSNYLDEYNSPGRINFESESKDTPRYEAFIASKESLSDHLLWQFLMTSPSRKETNIGSLIIGNLNRDGYLEISVEEIARMGASDPLTIEKILSLIQTFDPVGIGARDLKECLLIQIKHLKIDDTLVKNIITDHLGNLEKRNYKAICKALKTSIENVIAAVDIIQKLEPKPGREFSDE